MYLMTYFSGLLWQDFTDQMMSFIGQLTASKHEQEFPQVTRTKIQVHI